MFEKLQKIVLELLKKLLPAAREDPVAAALGALVLLAEVATLSGWQFQWTTSFTFLDFVSPILWILFLWRLYRRSWAAAPLGFMIALSLLVIFLYFANWVPFKRMSITFAEALITLILVVRDYP